MAAEQVILDGVRRLTPGAAILSEDVGASGGRAEESRPRRPQSNLADAVISVVLTSHFSPDEVAWTASVIRCLGERTGGLWVIVSGAVEMRLVARGRLDAFVSLTADAVSHTAPMPLLREAGGRITRLDGPEADDASKGHIAPNGHLHEELLAILRDA